MARDPKQDPYYNPNFSDEINEVTNDFVYKKTGKQTTGDAIIVRPRGGSFDVLLIERKRGPHQGGLALPGGFKEGADKVEDFVAREALEETGLTNKDIKKTIDLPTKKDRFDWDVRFPDGVDVSGKIFIVDENFIPIAGDDAVSAKFVPVEDIVSGKVDIAFLHSEWIYDTSQVLDSNYSGTSELQEVVQKDKKRNINFMKEINKKRAIDKQPLMKVDATPEISGSLDNISKQIIANEAGIKTFDQLINEFEGEFLKGLSPEDAESFANWYLDSGFDKEGKARAWLNENTDRLSDPRMIDDDTSFAMEQQGFDEVAETNKQYDLENALTDDEIFMRDVQPDIDEDALQNYRNKIESLEDLPETKYQEIVSRLSGDEIANLSEEDISKIYDEAGLKYNSEYGGVKPRGTKILKALDWLDPVEKAIAGMISSLGLPKAAKAYVTAEAANWFGNLTFEAAKSKGQADLLQSQILMGKATKEDIDKFKKTVMSNIQSGVERAEKISPSANVYNWIGKMLDR